MALSALSFRNATGPESYRERSESSKSPLHCRDYPMNWERPAAIFVWFVPGTRIFLAKAVYMEDPRVRRQVQPFACKLNTENIWR